jgi:tetraacyldisaccharide 4'-kinase
MSDAAAIIMTEKDAVKCRSFRLPNAWYVPVEAELPAAFRERFGEHLARLQRSRA